MNIPESAVIMMLYEANRQGLLGNEVEIYWVPPDSATQDERGSMIIRTITRSGSGVPSYD